MCGSKETCGRVWGRVVICFDVLGGWGGGVVERCGSLGWTNTITIIPGLGAWWQDYKECMFPMHWDLDIVIFPTLSTV